MRWAGEVVCMGERRHAYRVLVEKLKENTPLQKPRRRWEDNIRNYIKDIGWEGFYWTDLVQDKGKLWVFVNMVMNFGVPQNAGNFLTNEKLLSS
jgi:hypothetical protein